MNDVKRPTLTDLLNEGGGKATIESAFSGLACTEIAQQMIAAAGKMEGKRLSAMEILALARRTMDLATALTRLAEERDAEDRKAPRPMGQA